MAWLEHGSTREDAVPCACQPAAIRAPPRRLPARRRPRRVPRLGAAAARADRAARRRRATTRSSDAGFGVYEAIVDAAPGDDYAFVRRRRDAARPVLALAARGPARAVAASLDPGAFAWTDGGFAPPGLRRRSSSTSCTSARSRAEGTFDAAIPHLRGAARARRDRDRADAGGRVPRPPRLGLRRRLPARRAVRLRRPARASSGSSTPPTPRASRVMLDVVYNHVGASGTQGAGGLRPLLHRQARDALGRGDELRRRATPTPSASGCCQSAEQLGARLPPRRPAARRDPRDRRLQPRAPRRRDRRRVHARDPARS